MKNIISTDKAPAAIGPYSQAIEVNGMVYTSGMIPVNPATGEIPEGTVAQANQALMFGWLGPDVCNFRPISLNVTMSSLSFLWLSYGSQFLSFSRH